MASQIQLRPISAHAAASLAEGRVPTDVRVADDYPTEFSAEMGRGGAGTPLGLFFLHRVEDDVVVGEIGGGSMPASGRVLEKAGFAPTGEEDDEHDGVPLRVRRWELVL